MKLSKEIAEELKLHVLAKPEIVLNNKWKWKWSEISLGVRENEKQELENFLNDSITVLPYYLQSIDKIADASYKKKSPNGTPLNKKSFLPFLALRHYVRYSSEVTYTIQFNWDHEIFVDREEEILVPIEESGSRYYDSQLNLKWELGQLQPM